jgi:hypothetical protein
MRRVRTTSKHGYMDIPSYIGISALVGTFPVSCGWSTWACWLHTHTFLQPIALTHHKSVELKLLADSFAGPICKTETLMEIHFDP